MPIAISILATHRPRQAVVAVDLGRPHERVTIRTQDGVDLAAWYVPSRNGAAVVSYPTRQGALPEARMLVRHGYGVLLVDARGYDGSDGDPNVLGWGGEPDIDAAVAWLRRRPDVRGARIGGIGFSVGGEMMLQAAASNPALRAIVSEGAGVRSVREDLIRGPKGWLALPESALQTAAVALMSGTAPPPSLESLVRAHRAARRLPRLRGPRRRRRGAERGLLRRRGQAEADVEDRRGGSCRRVRGTTARVRAARDAILRPGAPRLRRPSRSCPSASRRRCARPPEAGSWPVASPASPR